MYTQIGVYPGASRLHDLVPQLSPQKSAQGYGTTESARTIALFQPYLAAVFPGVWTYAICAVIWANGSIPPHQDGDTVREHSTRHHLVISTNPHAWTWHGGTWQQLGQDGIYQMDPLEMHAAINWGSTPRIHLVVDTRLPCVSMPHST